MANITQRGDTYKIIVFVGRDADGKKIQKSTSYTPTAKTPSKIKKEVEQFAQDYENKVKNGECLDGETLRLNDYIPIWKENYFLGRDVGQRIIEDYEASLNNKWLCAFGHKYMSKITTTEIDAVIHSMINSGLSPKTIRKHFTALNSVFGYAYKKEIIDKNPCDRVDLPSMSDKNKTLHYFNIEQSKAFLKALDMKYSSTYSAHKRTLQSTGEVYSVPEYTESRSVGAMWSAYFYLALYRGLRRGEMCALKWKDFDFEKNRLSITRAFAKTRVTKEQLEKAPKTQAGIRELKIPQPVIDKLLTWKNEQRALSLSLGTQWKGFRGKEFDENYVFIRQDSGLAIDVDTPTHKFKEIINYYNSTVENEEDKLPDIRLHDLRHTSATLLISQGIDIETVARELGHSKPSITLDIYGHSLDSSDEKASDILEKIFA